MMATKQCNTLMAQIASIRTGSEKDWVKFVTGDQSRWLDTATSEQGGAREVATAPVAAAASASQSVVGASAVSVDSGPRPQGAAHKKKRKARARRVNTEELD